MEGDFFTLQGQVVFEKSCKVIYDIEYFFVVYNQLLKIY